MPVFAGLGLKALGFLKRVPPMVWVVLAVAAVLLFVIQDRNKWKARAVSYNAEAAASYEATKLASTNPNLARKDTVKQIALLGQAIGNLKGAIAHQNAAVALLGKQTVEQRNAAAEAVRSAAQRVSEAKAVSARLAASSRAGGRVGACEPSDALKGQWK